MTELLAREITGAFIIGVPFLFIGLFLWMDRSR